MATAVRTPIITTPPPTEIVLTLTEDEASVLRQVCANISGALDGPRGKMAAIAEALDAAGVKRSLWRRTGSIDLNR